MTATATKSPAKQFDPNKKPPLRPVGDRVLVLPNDPDSITKGGIIIPEQAKERAQYGIVFAVGPGKTVDGKFVAMTLERGDKVLFHPYQGHRIVVEGIEFLVLREADVMAVMD